MPSSVPCGSPALSSALSGGLAGLLRRRLLGRRLLGGLLGCALGGRALRVECGLQRRAGRELHGLRSLDRHRLTGARVATRARRSLRHGEGAEPGPRYLVTTLHRSGDRGEEGVEHPFGLVLLHPDRTGNPVDQFGFVHQHLLACREVRALSDRNAAQESSTSRCSTTDSASTCGYDAAFARMNAWHETTGSASG